MSSSDPLIGRILDGRWKIEAQIGRGGMGNVYRGRQLSVDRVVAIKVIRPKLVLSKDYTARFIREGRLATQLNHPNLVTAYDFGETEDGVLYLAMEYLSGVTLSTWLAEGPSLADRITAAIQILDALTVAHSKHIIHRDLKPGNVMLVDSPKIRVKVLDFGLAKNITTAQSMTGVGIFVGTLHYASPEQCRAGKIDGRSDLYGFGCLLYLMLSGRLPFEGLNNVKVRHNQMKSPPPPLDNLAVEGVSDALKGVVFRLLEKSPSDRYQTAEEAKAALAVAAEIDPADLRESPNPADETETEEMMGGEVIALRAAIAAMNTSETDDEATDETLPPEDATPRERRSSVQSDADDGATMKITSPLGLLHPQKGLETQGAEKDTRRLDSRASTKSGSTADKSVAAPAQGVQPVDTLDDRRASERPPEQSEGDPCDTLSTEGEESDLFGSSGIDSAAVTLIHGSATQPIEKPILSPLGRKKRAAQVSSLSKMTIIWSVIVAVVIAVGAGWYLGKSRKRAKPAPSQAPVVHRLVTTDQAATPHRPAIDPPARSPLATTTPMGASEKTSPIPSTIDPLTRLPRRAPPPPKPIAVAETHLTEAIAAFAQRDCVRAITAYDAFLTTSQIEDSRRTQALNRTTFCERELRLVNRLLYDAEAAFETENCRTALGLYTRFLERVPATHEQTSVVRDRVAFCRRKLDNSGAPSARPRP